MKPKGAFEGTIDSIAGTARLLFDWLGAEPTAEKPKPSILDLIPDGEPQLTEGVVRCSRCKHPIVKGACACKVAAIDTEGEDA